MSNPIDIKTLLVERIGQYLGSATGDGQKILSIFIGNPATDKWQFTGVLCVVTPIEQSNPTKATGAFVECQDWKITFINYSDNQRILNSIWETLKYGFPRISKAYTEADRSGSLERLIVNLPSDVLTLVS